MHHIKHMHQSLLVALALRSGEGFECGRLDGTRFVRGISGFVDPGVWPNAEWPDRRSPHRAHGMAEIAESSQFKTLLGPRRTFSQSVADVPQ